MMAMDGNGDSTQQCSCEIGELSSKDNFGHFMGVPQCTIRKVRSLEIVAYCGPLSTLLRMSHRYNKKDNKGSGSFQFEDLTVIVSTAVCEIPGILPTGHALDSSPPDLK
jgi:hypothetical protein